MSEAPFKVGDKVIFNHGHTKYPSWVIEIDKDFQFFRGYSMIIKSIKPASYLKTIKNKKERFLYSDYFELDETEAFHNQLESLVK